VEAIKKKVIQGEKTPFLIQKESNRRNPACNKRRDGAKKGRSKIGKRVWGGSPMIHDCSLVAEKDIVGRKRRKRSQRKTTQPQP